MTIVTCVVGMPGSGKTDLVNKMTQGTSGHFVADDIVDKSILPEKDIYSHVWIADPHFCHTGTRKRSEQYLTEKYGTKPVWIFFENDPVKCHINVAYRNDGRKVTAMIDMLTKVYVIPDGATPISIWLPPSLSWKLTLSKK